MENALLVVPAPSPVVITKRRLPRIPCPIMHFVLVSDSHSVDSVPVKPWRARTDCIMIPIPVPCNVTRVDLVLTRLVCLAPLSCTKSRDQTWVRLAARLPDVIINCCDPPREPRPTRHRTHVSDSHSVASQPVSPLTILSVRITTPMLPPRTVMDAEINEIRLLFPPMLMLIESAETA